MESDPDAFKLSPRNMLLMDKGMEHFTCSICLKVVLNPRECRTCQNMFCFSCLSLWDKDAYRKIRPDNHEIVQSQKICGLGCPKPQYGPVHRMVKNELANKLFKCGNGFCSQRKVGKKELNGVLVPAEYSMSFDEASQHQIDCISNNCGDCGEQKDSVDHDCVLALRAKIQKLESTHIQKPKAVCQQFNESTTEMINQLNLRLVESIPKCAKGHDMNFQKDIHVYFTLGKSPKSVVKCDKCVADGIGHNMKYHEFYYHCNICCEDLCRAHVIMD